METHGTDETPSARRHRRFTRYASGPAGRPPSVAASKVMAKRLDGVVERDRFVGQGHENQSVQFANPAGMQSVVLRAKVAGHQPGPSQRAVEPVRPRVVRTNECFRVAACFGADSRPAVPAYIVVRPDRAIAVAHDDDLLGADPEQEIVARVRNPGGVARQVPERIEDVFSVFPKHPGVAVERLREGLAGLVLPGQRREGFVQVSVLTQL